MTAADLIAEIDARLRRHHNDKRVVRDDWKALRGIPLAEAGLP